MITDFAGGKINFLEEVRDFCNFKEKWSGRTYKADNMIAKDWWHFVESKFSRSAKSPIRYRDLRILLLKTEGLGSFLRFDEYLV